ncbi:MAG: hypothetical protein ACLTTH_16045 [Holdemanella porci]
MRVLGLLLDSNFYKADIVVGGALKEYDGNLENMIHTLNENKVYSSKEYIIESIEKNEFYAPACFNLYKKVSLMKITCCIRLIDILKTRKYYLECF